MRRTNWLVLLMLVIVLVTAMLPASAISKLRETYIVAYNTTSGAWEMIDKGDLLRPTIDAVLTVKYDALAYMTITQANAAGVTFDSVSDGTAGFAFSDPVTVNAATTAASGLTVNYSKTAAADVGTVRALYGKYALTGATAVNTAGNNLVGVRGEMNAASGTSITQGAYLEGVQGKTIFAGTLNHADSRMASVFAQADYTGATFTDGQVSVIWADVQVAPTTTAVNNQFNLLRLTNGQASKTVQPNSAIYIYTEANALMELGEPEANGADWLYGGAHAQAAGSTNCIKIIVNGTTYYLALYDATPGS